MDDFTAKSDVYFAARKDSLYPALVHYKHRSEAVTGHRLLNIRLDNAGENTASTVKDFCNEHGITLEYSPPYAPQSNGIAERYMQELGMRARVLLFGPKLNNEVWGGDYASR